MALLFPLIALKAKDPWHTYHNPPKDPRRNLAEAPRTGCALKRERKATSADDRVLYGAPF